MFSEAVAASGSNQVLLPDFLACLTRKKLTKIAQREESEKEDDFI